MIREVRQVDNEMRPLTSLRMIAALLVFLHHYYPFAAEPRSANFWQSIALEGHIGVTVFFVLSGFLITLRYYNTFKSKPSREQLFDYIRKRIARIYPLYF